MKIKFKNQIFPLLHLYESTFKKIMRKKFLEVDNADFQLKKKTSSANFVFLKFEHEDFELCFVQGKIA